MQQYHRLMRRAGSLHTDGERDELLRVLASAPGASRVEIVGPHPKGGYRVRIELAPDGVDDFFAHLQDRGWTSVV